MNFLILLLLFISSVCWSQTGPFKLSEVSVVCKDSIPCNQRRQRLENLRGDYRSIVHLKDTLRIVASDGGYKSFTYDLSREADVFRLDIKLEMKSIIKEIAIGTVDRQIEADLTQLFSLREGEFFEAQKLKENIEGLQKRIDAMGYPHNKHRFEVIEKDDEIYIKIAIIVGPPRIFKKIKTDTKSSFIHDFLVKKFYNLYNKPFDFTRFKLYLDDAQKELFTYGYYLINMDIVPIIKNDRVILDIKVTNDNLYTFDFRVMHSETRDVLIGLMTGLYRQYKRPLTKSIIKQSIIEHYRNRAMLNVEVAIKLSTFRNKFKEEVNLFRIDIIEGNKTRLNKVIFTGNTYYPPEKLHKFFKKEAFELASIDYYDSEYLNYFPGYLKNRYLKNGFVQAKVDGPIMTFDPANASANVEYIIDEGKRAFVRSVNFTGLPPEFENALAKALTNKEGAPFNPIAMVDDIKKVSTLLQESGYYFAEVTNANEDNIVSYSKSGADVDLNFIINAGQIVRLNRVLYLGNDKTRKKVLNKKISLEEGDLISPSKTREIESVISATGLFNTVSVVPVRHTSKRAATDLIVKVTEREYGLVEIAPGYRTDLGLKLTGTASYQNIGGLNRSVTLRSQVNQRLNFQTFDPRRRREGKKRLEYNHALSYNQSDIFDTNIDFGMGTSYQRKRFYSFDADIWRINSTLTRDLTKKLSTSVRYQWETITQTDATKVTDNGSFRIGAFTPSLTYDLRNSQINPAKGAFFNLSCEFANPYFLSQDNSDLTINYYKMVSRNRFYVPFKNGTVAISMVGGLQENLATDLKTDATGQKVTEGYIPNIKVFRLTGMDIVRGFNDEEINRLPNGQDISEARVDRRAYLANFKLEPRFFLTDNFVAGVFYDAGRVFVNNADLGDLRDSVGVTFKILTPVGTLDFDYGIKLLRKKNQDGSLEDPGRFHVSIGFF
ncbi:MAG TPA: POTRA domain-containing protein [Bacteriovoracaceae bacterium]|nr:POTRA domain-containing protein [Bacteriovoracaceae bacterium]